MRVCVRACRESILIVRPIWGFTWGATLSGANKTHRRTSTFFNGFLTCIGRQVARNRFFIILCISFATVQSHRLFRDV